MDHHRGDHNPGDAVGSRSLGGVVVRMVSVPPRWLVAWACAPTHTRPLATAIPAGRLPTLIVRATVFVAGSISEIVPANWLATHTPRRSTAMAAGPSPTGIVAVTAFVWGLIRETFASRLFATHTEPSPTVIASGPRPTLIGWLS